MAEHTLDADYLVVGAGAAGLAFTDALTTDSDARVVIVDRRHAPGGHWNDAYPFVRLHQPSAFYGVNSLPLGEDAIDQQGPNEGHYERASGAEIVGYFRRVMDQRLLPSGKVRYFPSCEYLGDDRFVSRLSGDTYEVKVSKKVVDAKYLEPSIPATEGPPFEVAKGVRCIPINDLVHVAEPPERIVVIGGGKTAIDACLWLLENGVPPDAIHWIRPRDSLLANRRYFQPGDLAFEGFSLLVEAGAQAKDNRDLVDRVIASGQFFPLDEGVQPTMFKYATVNQLELDQLRSIQNVVRLGHVRRIDERQIVLDRGTVATSRGALHVHCAAAGLRLAPGVPIFGADTITLQAIRAGQSPFAAAITGFIEATREDVDEKNKLCPPNPYMDTPSDLARLTLVGMDADYQWGKHPDITSWLDRARLNSIRGIRRRRDEPRVQQSMGRFMMNARPAVLNLRRLVAEGARPAQRPAE
jgi:hypothetical protein